MIYDLKVRCNSCDRFLKVKAIASSEVVVTCTDRKCKQDNTIKVVMMSDYFGHVPEPKKDNSKELIEMKQKLEELDGRTKEAKELKEKIAEMENYISQLEGIIDAQG